MKPFEGKVALVTGATSGIGRATAVAFAREGARVVVTGRRVEEGQETVRLLQAASGEGLFVRSDVRKPAELAGMVKAAVDAYGRIDIAFNNAGDVGMLAPFHEQTEEVFDRAHSVNVKGL